MLLRAVVVSCIAWAACVACSTAQQLAAADFGGTTASIEPNRLVQVSRAAARLTVQLKSAGGLAVAQMGLEPHGGGCTVSPTQGVSDANGFTTFSLSSCGDGNVQLALDAVSGGARRRLTAEPNFVVYTPTGRPAAALTFLGPPFATAGRAEVYQVQALDDAGGLTDTAEGLAQLSGDANVLLAPAQPNLMAGWALVTASFPSAGKHTLAAQSVSDPTLQGNVVIDVYAAP